MNHSVRDRLEREFRSGYNLLTQSQLPWEEKVLRVSRLRRHYDKLIREAEKKEEVA